MPGTLRISRDCHRQVRDRFEVEAQPPVTVKGIADPVASYLVLREKPRAFGGESGETAIAMVGREAELARVVRIVEDARESRELRLFTVLADAGMGKSRLLVEVERLLTDEASLGRGTRILHGRAQRHGINTPDGVLRDLMSWHCDILDSDEPQVARDKLAATFGAAFGDRSAEQSALVGQLIGLDYANDPHIVGIVRDGRQIRARAFHAFAQYLRLLCEAHCEIVLLIDDLHWADDGSLDLIEFVATACADLPIVLGCFARSPLLDRRPEWGSGSAHASRIDLALLDAEGGGRLVDALLSHVAAPPPELRALILESAEGNPFHIQELLGMLIDDGVIVADADGWHVDRARLVQTKVPPTLIAVLQARLDALPSAEKQALQHESVVGSVFWDEALRVVAPHSIAALDMLVRRELINAHIESAFEGVREFEFKHHLLHQVTYDTVLKAAKRDLHKRTADWLVTVTGARIGEHLGLIADHYERAGEVASAVVYLRRASQAAHATASYTAAFAWIERAFALVDPNDERTRFELLRLRCQAFNSVGRRVEQARDVEEALALAESLDDDKLRAQAWCNEALIALIARDSERAVEASERAEHYARKVGDLESLVGALTERGQAQIQLSDFDAAKATLLSALPLAESLNRPDMLVVSLNRLNTIARDQADFDDARAYIERALAIAREAANRRFEGGLMNNLGSFEVMLGQFERASACLVTALDIARAIGDRGSEPYPLGNLAFIALQQDRFEEALALAEESVTAARAVGDIAIACETMVHAAHARVKLGDTARGFEILDEAIGLEPAVVGGKVSEIARASLLMDVGRFDEARPLVERLVATADQHAAGSFEQETRKQFVCYRFLVATGDERAPAFLVRAHDALMGPTARLNEDDRAAYLGNIKLHREIAAAWAGRGQTRTS